MQVDIKQAKKETRFIEKEKKLIGEIKIGSLSWELGWIARQEFSNSLMKQDLGEISLAGRS